MYFPRLNKLFQTSLWMPPGWQALSTRTSRWIQKEPVLSRPAGRPTHKQASAEDGQAGAKQKAETMTASSVQQFVFSHTASFDPWSSDFWGRQCPQGADEEARLQAGRGHTQRTSGVTAQVQGSNSQARLEHCNAFSSTPSELKDWPSVPTQCPSFRIVRYYRKMLSSRHQRDNPGKYYHVCQQAFLQYIVSTTEVKHN